MDKDFETTEDGVFWIFLIFAAALGWFDNKDRFSELIELYKQEKNDI